MSMEVNRVFAETHKANQFVMQHRAVSASLNSARSSVDQATAESREVADLDIILAELQSVTQIFDRKLEFSVNPDLDQVVVKVIDKSTDRVIKEIPPAELQRVHTRIREAIGLFVDEQI